MVLRYLTRVARIVTPLVVALPLSAQGVVGGITPVIGYYRPFGHFAPATVYETSLPERPDVLSATAWGATAHLAFHRRVGILAQFIATNSRVPEVITPAGPRGPTNARVTIASVQGQFDLSPAPRAYHFWVSAGPAVVNHGGEAYAPLASTSALAGAAGATFAVPLISRLQFTATSALVFYRMNIPMPPSLKLNSGSLERGNQLDALIHVGLTFGSI